MVEDIGGVQHCLCGNATHMQTGAAQLVAGLDQCHLQTILCSAEGAGITSRAAANDGHIKDRICHKTLSKSQAGVLRWGRPAGADLGPRIP